MFSSSRDEPYIMKVYGQGSRWRRDIFIVFIYFWSKVAQVTLTEVDSICKNPFLFIQMQIIKIRMTIIITIISPQHLYTDRMWKYMDRNTYFNPSQPHSFSFLNEIWHWLGHKRGHFSTKWAEISNSQTTIFLGKWEDFPTRLIPQRPKTSPKHKQMWLVSLWKGIICFIKFLLIRKSPSFWSGK